MFNLDVSKLDSKQEQIAGVKMLQIQQIIREDMEINFPRLTKEFRDEMNLITVCVESIVKKATKESKDASDDSAVK